MNLPQNYYLRQPRTELKTSADSFEQVAQIAKITFFRLKGRSKVLKITQVDCSAKICMQRCVKAINGFFNKIVFNLLHKRAYLIAEVMIFFGFETLSCNLFLDG